ncbi:hypothetical protein M405DRAFT_808582 [Rhizopogon salebrosus TDB-379]|nr:hypothetical protein M405DRAFT_808582 [Rhizopogon salebrosus TDB-379]
MENASTSSSNKLPASCRPPKHFIWGPAFKLLCIIAVSRTSLEHWKDTKGEGWKEHIKVTTNRFQYSNLTAGLILTTTAVLLSSSPPLTDLMDYDAPASYIIALIAFGAALLSVISGAAVLVMYETGTSHKDMDTLKHMSRRKVICLLLWLAWPSVCLAVATFCLFLSVFIACLRNGSIIVQIIAALSFLAFFVNSILALDVFTFVGKPPIQIRGTPT